MLLKAIIQFGLVMFWYCWDLLVSDDLLLMHSSCSTCVIVLRWKGGSYPTIKTTLDGLNYAIWSQEMSSLLKGRKLWRFVTSYFPKPTKQKDEDDNKYLDRLEDQDSKNHLIFTWIRNTSVPSIKHQFAGFEIAKKFGNC